VSLPAAGSNPIAPVTQAAGDAVEPVVQGATGAAQGATGAVQGATQPVTGAVNQTGDTGEDTTGVPVPTLP
jgi:hypothetical protein